MSYFKCLVFFCLLFPRTIWAEKANFTEFCGALGGQWQGSSAKLKQKPKYTTVDAICSADKRQLLLSVSANVKGLQSETWWFRSRGDTIFLIYFNGVDEDKKQEFSLYNHNGSYSLLGEGELNSRPALIQLRFDVQDVGWLWLQKIQYLDDDNDRYLFYRGIEMIPISK